MREELLPHAVRRVVVVVVVVASMLSLFGKIRPFRGGKLRDFETDRFAHLIKHCSTSSRCSRCLSFAVFSVDMFCAYSLPWILAGYQISRIWLDQTA